MQRPTPRDGKSPIASWSRGERIQRTNQVFAGIFLDVAIDPELDTAAARASWPQGTMRHKDGGAREHYLLPAPTLVYVLISGLPYRTVGALCQRPADAAAAGIACRWRSDLGERSAMGVHLLFDDLVRVGYTRPIPFVVRSNHTDDLLAALLAHNSVLDRAESALGVQLAFYSVALPIVPGDDVPRGASSDASLTSTVQPITCGHPDQLSGKYIREMSAPAEVADVAAQWEEEIQRYAADFAARVPLGRA
jgi:hypothetical protein